MASKLSRTRTDRRTLTAGLGVLMAACAAAPAAQPIGPTPLVVRPIERFEPLVAPTSTAPRCERPDPGSLDAGQRSLSLVFGAPPTRKVTVTLGAEGAPIRYIDVRGELLSDGSVRGDRTTIGLYLDADYAVLSNRAGDGRAELFEVPLEDAIGARRLGSPDAVLDEVLSRCGSGPTPSPGPRPE